MCRRALARLLEHIRVAFWNTMWLSLCKHALYYIWAYVALVLFLVWENLSRILNDYDCRDITRHKSPTVSRNHSTLLF